MQVKIVIGIIRLVFPGNIGRNITGELSAGIRTVGITAFGIINIAKPVDLSAFHSTFRYLARCIPTAIQSRSDQCELVGVAEMGIQFTKQIKPVEMLRRFKRSVGIQELTRYIGIGAFLFLPLA